MTLCGCPTSSKASRQFYARHDGPRATGWCRLVFCFSLPGNVPPPPPPPLLFGVHQVLFGVEAVSTINCARLVVSRSPPRAPGPDVSAGAVRSTQWQSGLCAAWSDVRTTVSSTLSTLTVPVGLVSRRHVPLAQTESPACGSARRSTPSDCDRAVAPGGTMMRHLAGGAVPAPVGAHSFGAAHHSGEAAGDGE